MKRFKNMSYAERIRWRNRILYLVGAAMLVYMVVISEMGGGDSRIVTRLADMVSDLILFGGLLCVIFRIRHNKKLLQNRLLLKEQQLEEADERNRYLHDKSGGIVLDILLVCLLFTTATAGMFQMAAFYVSFGILALALVLKAAVYYFYSRME